MRDGGILRDVAILREKTVGFKRTHLCVHPRNDERRRSLHYASNPLPKRLAEWINPFPATNYKNHFVGQGFIPAECRILRHFVPQNDTSSTAIAVPLRLPRPSPLSLVPRDISPFYGESPHWGRLTELCWLCRSEPK